ncbi:MAG: hypothetical protein M1457_11495, partial [bacterium]|nr:hypothetical protein [bacterium]
PSPIRQAQAGIAFGAIDRSLDGYENTCNRWVALRREDGYMVAILNEALHGFSVTPGEFRQSLVRSVIANYNPPIEPYRKNHPAPFLDLGQHDILLRVTGGPADEAARRIGHDSELLRLPLDARLIFPSTRRNGTERSTLPGVVELSDTRIVMTALKRSEDGAAWIVRGLNATAEPVACEVRFAGCEPVAARFGPWRVFTWRTEAGRLKLSTMEEE